MYHLNCYDHKIGIKIFYASLPSRRLSLSAYGRLILRDLIVSEDRVRRFHRIDLYSCGESGTSWNGISVSERLPGIIDCALRVCF